MKALFVSSGNNKKFPIAPFIKSQGDSLIKQGIVVEYFTIKCRGITGYLKCLPHLRKQIKNNNYDIIHAHYGLCGCLILLAKQGTPVGVSFMGNDLYGDADLHGNKNLIDYPIILINKILQYFVDFIIVKSENLAHHINKKQIMNIIPNGVNIRQFYPEEKHISRKRIGMSKSSETILFVGDKLNSRKNYKLLVQSLKKMKKKLTILEPYPVSHFDLLDYYNSTDIFILTSYKEGSPNVVKEAMACNCPVVSTDVGDVKWIFGDTEGCYLTSFSPIDVAEKIHKALDFAKNKDKTNGRDRIIALGLDSDVVAKKIFQVYLNVLEKKNVRNQRNYKSK